VTSHSSQNRSFSRRFSPPIYWPVLSEQTCDNLATRRPRGRDAIGWTDGRIGVNGPKHCESPTLPSFLFFFPPPPPFLSLRVPSTPLFSRSALKSSDEVWGSACCKAPSVASGAKLQPTLLLVHHFQKVEIKPPNSKSYYLFISFYRFSRGSKPLTATTEFSRVRTPWFLTGLTRGT